MQSTEHLPASRSVLGLYAPWQEARHGQVWVTTDVREKSNLAAANLPSSIIL
jgi:hypothetical protein